VAFAVFATDAKSGLDHGGEYQNRDRLVSEFARGPDFVKEQIERGIDAGVDLGPDAAWLRGAAHQGRE
jgi:hypothetical protein